MSYPAHSWTHEQSTQPFTSQPLFQPRDLNRNNYSVQPAPQPAFKPEPSDMDHSAMNTTTERFAVDDLAMDAPSAAGVATRKKTTRKPGPAAKPKPAEDAASEPKSRKTRRPRDPDAPPVQRKRKGAPADDDDGPPEKKVTPSPPITYQPKITDFPSMRGDSIPPTKQEPQPAPLGVARREAFTGSMRSLLNDDPPPAQPSSTTRDSFADHTTRPAPPAPVRTSGQRFDPIRSSYDPVRETMVSSAPSPYGAGALASPRASNSQAAPRASSSPSIASLIDPVPNMVPPSPTQHNYHSSGSPYAAPAARSVSQQQQPTSTPPSPTRPSRPAPQAKATSKPQPPPLRESRNLAERTKAVPVVEEEPVSRISALKAAATEQPKAATIEKEKPVTDRKRPSAPSSATGAAKATAVAKTLAKPENKTTINRGSAKADKATAPPSGAGAAVVATKAVLGTKTGNASTTSSSARLAGGKDKDKDKERENAKDKDISSHLGGSTNERSILDFGKAQPGEEVAAPSIVLHIPLNGETNKYVNFMRMAEESYGWDALHPRLAAQRDRRARIEAASAALAKNESSRDSGEDMSGDDMSDAENSHLEPNNGGGGGGGGGGGLTSGADNGGTNNNGEPAKKPRKKRLNKEDQYDRDDDFVDDSELLWEEQAAASMDGFFVYSGPLVPEVEKPAPGKSDAPKRGRGSRGGRGGASTRGGAAAGAGRGTGRGRGGGPGSRGGTAARKPRMTKSDREQAEREKAERIKSAAAASTATAAADSDLNVVNPATSPLARQD